MDAMCICPNLKVFATPRRSGRIEPSASTNTRSSFTFPFFPNSFQLAYGPACFPAQSRNRPSGAQGSARRTAGVAKSIVSLPHRIGRAQTANQGSTTAASATATEEDDNPRLRFRAAGFATLRKKLGLSAAEMGKLIGVTQQTVYHWEKGQARPRASQLQNIAAIRKLGKRGAAAKLAEM
jgi:DNA-binding transcriptional regulator YiaG